MDEEEEQSVDIYHNPRCSKSRATLALLEERGIDVSVIEYLKEPPDDIELRQILDLLAIPARELLRTGEAPYKELGLDDMSLSEDAIIEAIVNNPILMERPIVVTASKARIGRPPEAVLEIL
ncbi:MAG: arsenate reductase (glutaredoxin) [Alphaproteobacteria bacterium]|jgi:arsenate reductase|nr:arsenate reductase (glutaredoxin) [Alphaproteobacteria bacterium]